MGTWNHWQELDALRRGLLTFGLGRWEEVHLPLLVLIRFPSHPAKFLCRLDAGD